MSPVTAPTAPGRLNEPVQPQAMVGYLGELDAWVAARRSELAALDAEILLALHERFRHVGGAPEVRGG